MRMEFSDGGNSCSIEFHANTEDERELLADIYINLRKLYPTELSKALTLLKEY